MSLFQAVILGIVQGITEFAPISSSAHLVLIPDLMGWAQPDLSFDVMLHLGTLTAVICFFRSEISELFIAFVNGFKKKTARQKPECQLAWLIIIGTIPAIFIGLLFQDFFEGLFSNPLTVSLLLMVTGTFLWISEAASKKLRVLDDISLSDTLIIGLAQGCAIAPGISRSGATIAAGLFRGLNRDSAARFSFLLAIPIILGAVILKTGDFICLYGEQKSMPLLAGFLAAAVSGYLCIKYLLNYLKKGRLTIFAYYCWFVGAAFLLIR
ncbi:undecaprenyl-diphosphatase UppP [Candidatus Oleimmundimicrobium sp.]|uniref:undecaprenyl-diphosphatase UppP n=1 Tax=Candidatus Oleimmundimicrobium sp. TaxID=3060597 RepID=UPI0027158741|nr:undecaprenyl-diphosphatase UppP [Candidatus Oleimmundimicrobium sp.]MDO8885437.1 undecaprenyl-diphosphatase UppP [Candidatus Oleimmundimicrobium sp.]